MPDPLPIRLAMAQVNPTVGDIDANAGLIERWSARAREERADLVVFPELTLTGYPPRDLLLQEGFVEHAAATARRLASSLPQDLTVIFGLPLPVDRDPRGRGLANALLVCREGRVTACYDKRLLPTYDVFDENRYFVRGERAVVVTVKGVPVGLSICEDLWRGQDVGYADRYLHLPDPVAELAAAGARLIVNPSASPFRLTTGARHRALLSRVAAERRVWVAGVNQVGANDELIFDGHSALVGPDGVLAAAAPGFVEHLLVHDPGRSRAPDQVRDPLRDEAPEALLFAALRLGIADYCRKTGFRSVVLGLSGGIDSAVCAVLAAAALGPSRVHALSMPGPYSSPGSVEDAADLARRLGIRLDRVPIGPAFECLLASLGPLLAGHPPDITEENLQSRLRGTILMAASNKLAHLLLTTGNKSELAVGYCTLYGDMNGGLAVLSDLTKQWVYRLARWMNAHPHRLGIPGLDAAPIPEPTLTKPPSAELRPNQTDQDTLPPYELLDEIIERYVELRQSPRRIADEIAAAAGRPAADTEAVVARVVRMIDLAEYKRRQAPTGLKVTGVAFGTGRRMPIAQGWRPDRLTPA
jgi:NAD+ synthase (glutamine-hydrolysing)